MAKRSVDGRSPVCLSPSSCMSVSIFLCACLPLPICLSPSSCLSVSFFLSVCLSSFSCLSAYVISGLITAYKSVWLAEQQIIFHHLMVVNWITLLNDFT